ncbi:hypothetical protein l13_04490 [Neisseria weaveri ATCC 51223]|nr:hypothetical protein l13_04490 [Neisseria weaveri ATCC 51223]
MLNFFLKPFSILIVYLINIYIAVNFPRILNVLYIISI